MFPHIWIKVQKDTHTKRMTPKFRKIPSVQHNRVILRYRILSLGLKCDCERCHIPPFLQREAQNHQGPCLHFSDERPLAVAQRKFVPYKKAEADVFWLCWGQGGWLSEQSMQTQQTWSEVEDLTRLSLWNTRGQHHVVSTCGSSKLISWSNILWGRFRHFLLLEWSSSRAYWVWKLSKPLNGDILCSWSGS